MQKPNFLIFMMDTQRARNMSCYGYHRQTTPSIDKIAEEGVFFENHFTPGVWTVPTHASLFTGQYIHGHGCDVGHEYLEDDFPTMAEVFNRHGYHTAGICVNGWVEQEKTCIARGFTEWHLSGPMEAVPPFVYDDDPDKKDNGSWKTVGLVRKWLDEHVGGDPPFVLFVNCAEPHMKYWPPEPFRSKFLLPGTDQDYAKELPQKQFEGTAGQVLNSPDDWQIIKSLRDGETATLDHRMGLIFDYMREQGMLDSTVLMITGDHGDSTGEHGAHTAHCQCAVWDTTLHTPLIIRYPERFPAGKRVRELVQSVDIFPTMMDLAGIEDEAAEEDIQGKSLIPTLDGQAIREFAMAECTKPLEPWTLIPPRIGDHPWDPRDINASWKCARTLEYKYHWSSRGDDRLYHVGVDIDEQQNIIGPKPEIAAELKQKLEDLLLSLTHRDYGDYLNTVHLHHASREVIDRLKAWGLMRDVIGQRRFS